jgi:hypothetical protein
LPAASADKKKQAAVPAKSEALAVALEGHAFGRN